MPVQLSPGVAVVEKDFSNIIPTVSSGIGAIAGRFTKGPINTPILISSEDELVSVFGLPDDTNANEWFTASQFLQYTNKLWTVRSAATGVKNATGSGTGVAIFNETAYSMYDLTTLGATDYFVSRTPGTFGNSVQVIMVDANSWDEFTTWVDAGPVVTPDGAKLTALFNDAPSQTPFIDKIVNNTTITSVSDEIYVLIIDKDGKISGAKNTVLEMYTGLSKASDAVNYKGDSIYYVNAINNNSRYVWFGKAPTTTTPDATHLAFGSSGYDVSATVSFTSLNLASTVFMNVTLSGGHNGTASSTIGEFKTAYDTLENTDLYDLNLVLSGAPNVGTQGELGNYLVTNLADKRKDCIVFISPYATGGKPFFDTDATKPVSSIPSFKTTMAIPETYASFAVIDTGFKYMYDRYNNKYRWVPLNGDIAGICARTDDVADPWYSPGGFNRGGVKNVVKLSYNPNQADRDILYPKGINPVVSFPGQGPVLWGDRTAATKPSAFDRINVRRLFLILEKAISIAAKYQLFEFNDSFTRAQFRNMVEPYLRNIQGRRGIVDFKVVCDESNNTGQVIDSNQFVADIYIKPNRSINFITLSFVATRTDVSFSSVVGG